MAISFKQLHTVEELQEIRKLEKAVWGMEPLPIHQTFTAVQNGGIVLAAYNEQQIIGFQYSFPGFLDGEVYLCSHMMGVRPEVQQRGVGMKLKEKQRDVALKMGYQRIVWTFDPLLSMNAYLNLHKLGAVATQYFENYYGQMQDSLNAGLPSDRFKVEWFIASERVSKVHSQCQSIGVDPCPSLLKVEERRNGWPVPHSLTDMDIGQRDTWRVPIPKDFQSIKTADPELALDWRLKSRKVFHRLVEAGFVACDFFKTEQKVNDYIFVRDS